MAGRSHSKDAGFWRPGLSARAFGGIKHVVAAVGTGREGIPATERCRVPVVPLRDAVYFPGLINALHVVRPHSKLALEAALGASRRLVCVLQRDSQVEEASPDDLCRVGTLCEVLNATRLPDGTYRVALRGLARGRVPRAARRSGFFWSSFEEAAEPTCDESRAEALAREVLEGFSRLAEEGRRIPPESVAAAAVQESPVKLGWVVAHHLPLRPAEKQSVLEGEAVEERLETLLRLIVREQSVLDCRTQIRQAVHREVAEHQRETLLREQLRAIQEQIRQIEGRKDPIEELREAFESPEFPEQVRRRARAEIDRLEHSGAFSPEGASVLGYLEWLREMPWKRFAERTLDPERVRRVLDECHFGLWQVKRRVMEQLAVLSLRPDAPGPVLCFVGPPGVGKTSLAKAVAEALGRPFVSVSLGGVRDDAEIRGHRRTYVGSMPGRIVQGIRQAGVCNPVVLLDEIDKIGSDGRGDPTGALLEVLDPSQNKAFRDLYLDLPLDLSRAFFIATANTLERVPRALWDRLEPVEFDSYTPEERMEMARSHLIPEAMAAAGLTPADVDWTEGGLQAAVLDFVPEPGVRALSRRLAALCRLAALNKVEGRGPFRVDEAAVHAGCGEQAEPARHRPQRDLVGVANALVVSESGGAVLPIEVSLVEPSGPAWELVLTGNLGAVMRESAQTALTYVRSIRRELGVPLPLGQDVHVHAPEGAIPKDGPSAGLAIVAALVSAWTGRPVDCRVALTGEVTLRGRVLPVGGLREKLLAVQRAGLRAAVVPEANRADAARLPESLRRAIEIRFVSGATEALEAVLGPWAES